MSIKQPITDSGKAFQLAVQTDNHNLVVKTAEWLGLSQRQVYRMFNGQAENPVHRIERAFKENWPPFLDPGPVLARLCNEYGYMIIEIPVTQKDLVLAKVELRQEMQGQLVLQGMNNIARQKHR